MRAFYLLVCLCCLTLAAWSEPFFDVSYDSMFYNGVLPFRVSAAFLKKHQISSMVLDEEGGSERWTFRADGQAQRLEDSNSVREWRYEGNRLVSADFTYRGRLSKTLYSYQNGLLSRLQNGDEITIDYSYQDGRLSREVCRNGKNVFVSDYHYSGGLLSSITRKDGFYHRFGYDRQGRLTSYTTPLEGQKLSYNKLGQLEQLGFYQKQRRTRLYRFDYDSQGLLTRFVNEDWETARPQFNTYTVSYPTNR